jgi:transposase InsO family protein
VAQGKADEAILTASIIEIEQWRVHYNAVRPHSFLQRKPPAPEPLFQVEPMMMMN